MFWVLVFVKNGADPDWFGQPGPDGRWQQQQQQRQTQQRRHFCTASFTYCLNPIYISGVFFTVSFIRLFFSHFHLTLEF